MSNYREEARRDADARAARKRADADAAAERAIRARSMAGDVQREQREKEREAKTRAKREARRLRAERAARRARALTPENIYRRGTLTLVIASALASLPAQILHFVSISLMLLPIPFALEGAAWVATAGVAFADARKLAAWVRWMLRGVALGAASFAAHINYSYGLSLTRHGLDAGDAQVAAVGLAAVTLGGPLFFEIRQWVGAMAAATGDPRRKAEEQARRRHDKQRRRQHKSVARIADQMQTAAPFGTLTDEAAWAAAWAIVHGTQTPGMTPALHAQAARARAALEGAFDPKQQTERGLRTRILERLLSPLPNRRPVLETSARTVPIRVNRVIGKAQVASDLPPSSKKAPEKRRKGARKQPPPHRRSKGDSLPFHPLARAQAADTARSVSTVNGHHH